MSVLNLSAVKKDLGDFIGKKLDNSTIPTTFVKVPGSTGTTVSGGPVSAVFGATVDLSISLINGSGDADDDVVIDMGSHGDSVAFAFNPADAWLKYTVSAKCTAAATATIGTAGAAVNGDRTLKLLYYRKHNRGDDLLSAVGEDAKAFASVLALDEVTGLSPGDAVALATGGELKASLTVTWSDILSVSGGAIGQLARTLGATGGMIDVKSGLTVSFDIAVDDTYMLTIACLDRNSYRVVLSTTKSVESHLGATFGITASLSAGDAKAIVTSLKSGWLGVAEAELAEIDAKTSLDKLSPAVKAVVDQLIDRLHLPKGDWNELKSRLASFDTQCTTMLTAFAETKLALAFTYEYRRIDTKSALVNAAIDGDTLRRHHASLLKFDLAALLSDGAVTVKKSVVSQVLEETRGWNFTIGIGSWKAGSSQKQTQKVTLRDMDTPSGTWKSYAFAGSCVNHDGDFVGADEYGLLLSGDAERAPSLTGATVWKSDGALGLWWSDNRLFVSADKALAEIIDNATLFGLVTEDGAADMSGRIANANRAVKGARLDVSLTGDAMRRAIKIFANATHDDWAKHAARAMSSRDGDSRLTTPSMRETMYGAFLKAYGGSPYMDSGMVESMGHKYFRDNPGYSKYMAAAFGASYNDGGRFWVRWNLLGEGASHFASLLQGSVVDWTTFGKSFDDRFVAGTQTWFVRTMASLLAERLGPSLHDDPAYSVCLTLGDASKGATKLVYG